MPAAPTLTDGVVTLRGRVDGPGRRFAVEVDGRDTGTIGLYDEGEGRARVDLGTDTAVPDLDDRERAVRALLEWAFSEQGLQVVVWRAPVGAWLSRRLAWRLGFSFDGTVRRSLALGGELVDGWVGTLLDTDDRGPRAPWLEVPVLEADGLRLRPWRDSDVPRIVEACNDDRTQRWLGRMPSPYTEADALIWLEHQRESRARGQAVNWAVVTTDADDRALASINAFDLVPKVEVEIGYWAHPGARGRGVMTRSMSLVVRYAFETLGVRRVTAGAAVDNAASRRVIEANGLRAWGTERAGTAVQGGRADLVWYDVLVEEWRRARHG